MDGRVFGVGINEDKPIASQIIDCMVNMHMTPRLLWKHQGVAFVLFGTSSKPMAEVHDLGIHPWPVHCCAMMDICAILVVWKPCCRWLYTWEGNMIMEVLYTMQELCVLSHEGACPLA